MGETGNWSTAANWTPNAVPNNGSGNTYDVSIGSKSSAFVLLDISPSIDSLMLGSNGIVYDQSSDPQTLTIAGPLRINAGASLYLNSSIVNAGASSSNTGALSLEPTSELNITGDLTNSRDLGDDAFLNVTGALINKTQGNISFDGVARLGSLINNGTVTIYGGTVNVANGIADIAPGSTLDLGGGALISGNSSGVAPLTSIEGSLIIADGQSITITPNGGTLTNSGNFAINTGYYNIPTNVTVNGALAFKSESDTYVGGNTTLTISSGIGDIPLNSTLEVYGTLNSGNRSALRDLTRVEGNLVLGNGQSITITPNSGTLTNSGRFEIVGTNTAVTISGNLNGGGGVDVGSQDTLNVSGTFTNDGGFLVYGTANLGTLINTGIAVILNGATVNVANGIIDIVSNSILNVDGNLNLKSGGSALGGLTSIEGYLNIASGQPITITPAGGTLIDSGVFMNDSNVTVNGTLALSGSGLAVVGGLTLAEGVNEIPQNTTLDVMGVINSGANSAMLGLTTIAGTLDLENGQTTTVTPNGGTLTNTGTFSVIGINTGVTLVGDLKNENLVSVSSAGTLNAAGTFTNMANGLFFVDEKGIANLGMLANYGNTTVVTGGAVNAKNIMNAATASLVLGSFLPGGVLNASRFANGGSTSVGSGATLGVGSGPLGTDTTGLHLFSNGTLAELLFGSAGANTTCTGAAGNCGIISVLGDVMLSGTLDPMLQNGFDPMNGDSFLFLSFTGGLTGRFSSIADQYFNNNTQQWVITYGSDFVKLTAEPYGTPPITSTPEPGALSLFGLGLLGLGLLARLRRKK